MIDIPDTHRIKNTMIRILHQAHILITTATMVAAMTAVGIVVAETVEVAGIKPYSLITKEGCTHYCVNTIRVQPFAVL
ncbi:cell division protein, FtsW [Paenibacillus amylolyticus]|uniref:Cell division protein, FtsW n=1 Tax=Paenibacillus amylolyticus TaxID=1451 RepID=A0A100VSI9_PAEAM|nr:cell division protein, FtsW [Paenibacillus amylolyticus]